MVVLSVRMNNEQHGAGLGFNLSRADRVPAFFSRFAICVRIDEGSVRPRTPARPLQTRFRRVSAGSAGSWLHPIRNALRIYIVYYIPSNSECTPAQPRR